MSNLKFLRVSINLEKDDDDLRIEFNPMLNDEILYIKDCNSDESITMDVIDFPGFVQKFLYHSKNYSSLSLDKTVTEIKLPLPNSDRDCYMRKESELCVFPNKRYPDGTRAYEVRVSFENMETILSLLNSFT